MKNESLIEPAARPDVKPTPEPPSPRPRKGNRRSSPEAPPEGTPRFFLSKTEPAGVPALDREFDSEAEALVESLKTGRSYFVIVEWKGLADLSQQTPRIRKEAVTRKPKTP